ncbi:hypothetical protein JG688_00010315 [Phytophthora aleatoria]|uniref:Uncharacterized protein n=1 Tax=Phytophthora aleatoria TaxID=2496075 RepID=A0A8J5IMD1_9STRA|nr:hypothetical protein JG688_00010315 [Phytophthora aleatoria]
MMTREDSYRVDADGYTTKWRPTQLPRREFVVAWLVLMTLHALCAAYLLAMARLYFFMENPNMAYISNLLAFPEQRRFRLFGVLVGILGGLHAVQLILHIASSIHSRALVVWPRDAVITRFKKFIPGYKPGKTSSFAESKSRIHNTGMPALTAIEKTLSVQGSHFELIFVLRKAVEVAAQIYQCHNYSTLISPVWINQAFVVMTVINCLITPLLNHLMLASASRAVTKVASTRSLSARIPAIRERTFNLKFSTTTCNFIPWARRFDPIQSTFPTEILYDDTTYTRLIYENQSIFALSATDSLLKIIPHGSLLFGLVKYQLHSREKSFESLISQEKRWDRNQSIFTTPTYRMVSAVVLALHIRADKLVANANSCIAQMCEQSVRPWSAHNVSCSVVMFNCYRQGVTSPAENALDSLERNALASIIFEHCSEFRMPSSIREFPNLLGLELWNVTILNWGIEAALNANLHPKMGFLHSSLEEFPTAFFRLPIVEVSLVNNNLKTLPGDLFSSYIFPSFYTTLALSYNPLQVLPKLAKELRVIDEL